jgi:PST family polysaccharide transporter
VLGGGAYLTVRQALGTLLNAGGVLLLARILGPGRYGLYAAAVGIFGYIQLVSGWGISIFLIRHDGEDRRELLDQASTLLLLFALAGAAVGLAASPLLERWTRLPGLAPLCAVLLAGLPLQAIASVPLAGFERALDFRRVAWVELAAQATFFLLALPLAFLGWGAWAPVVGWWAQQLVLAVLCFAASHYRPRWHWERSLAREIVGYGLGYSASIWIWQIRRLVNPLVVGRLLGAQAVGVVALAAQMVLHLAFIATVSARLSTSALARVQRDTARLARALGEGMRLQVVAVALPLVLFAWLGQPVIIHLFGVAWLPVLVVYPFIALGALTNALFSLHSSALYVRRLNWDVAVFHCLHILLFAGATILLVPRMGLVGYGWAEIVAIASYLAVHLSVRSRIGPLRYGDALALWAAFGLALWWRPLGWLSLAGLGLLALLPRTWREGARLWAGMRGWAYGA